MKVADTATTVKIMMMKLPNTAIMMEQTPKTASYYSENEDGDIWHRNCSQNCNEDDRIVTKMTNTLQYLSENDDYDD